MCNRVYQTCIRPFPWFQHCNGPARMLLLRRDFQQQAEFDFALAFLYHKWRCMATIRSTNWRGIQDRLVHRIQRLRIRISFPYTSLARSSLDGTFYGPFDRNSGVYVCGNPCRTWQNKKTIVTTRRRRRHRPWPWIHRCKLNKTREDQSWRCRRSKRINCELFLARVSYGGFMCHLKVSC